MSRAPHVCMVCCQHVPDDVRVTQKLGAEMREAGMRVTWVGPERPRRGDDLGIDFRYYPLGSGKKERLLRHRAARAVAERVPDVDVYYAPEPDSAHVANALARARGAASIFDIHEVYHDEMLSRWAEGPLRAAMSAAVRLGMLAICARADLVVAVSEAVLAPYRSVPTRKLIVRNCAPLSFAEPGAAEVFPAGRRGPVLLHGKTTRSHGTEAVVRAAGLAARGLPGLPLVMFDTFGSVPDGFGRADFDRTVADAGASASVDLRQTVPMAAMPGILRESDVGLIAYDRTWGRNSLPNKLFEYMGAGIPIIAPSYAEEIRRIVEPERCGVLVDTESPEAIAGAIAQLAADPDEARAMGRRGREAFLARHNFRAEAAPLLDAIRAMVRS